MGSGGRAGLVYGLIATGNYFTVLGVKAERGRTLLPEDDRAIGARPGVVVSHGLWQRRFGSDPGLVGRIIKLNGHPFTAVGIAPEGFAGPQALVALDLWVPATKGAQAAPTRANARAE